MLCTYQQQGLQRLCTGHLKPLHPPRGTRMKCIWGESRRNPLLRPEWGGGAGFQMTDALRLHEF